MKQGRGFLLILSAPSGAGKSTLARWLVQNHPGVCVSVSTTTRPPRPGEEEGVHYFFVTREVFESHIQEGRFLEWAQVFGNHYGTSRLFVEQKLSEGEVVVLDIDWQGARQVKKEMAQEDVVTLFIAPPSMEVLRGRLEQRKQDPVEVIDKRMAAAKAEMSHWREYDYFLVNDLLEEAHSGLAAVIQAERLRRSRLSSQGEAVLRSFGLAE